MLDGRLDVPRARCLGEIAARLLTGFREVALEERLGRLEEHARRLEASDADV
jgi:hypothetical protein